MKSKPSSHHLWPGLACLLFAFTAFSCQTTSSSPKTTHVPMSVTGTRWVKVLSQPPTYYPRGVAADCPTDYSSGEWVYTDDEKGTRYFIPLHGLGKKRELLVHEALAARSGRKIAQINAEVLRDDGNMALVTPVATTGVIVGLIAYETVDLFSYGMLDKLIEDSDRLKDKRQGSASLHGW